MMDCREGGEEAGKKAVEEVLCECVYAVDRLILALF